MKKHWWKYAVGFPAALVGMDYARHKLLQRAGRTEARRRMQHDIKLRDNSYIGKHLLKKDTLGGNIYRSARINGPYNKRISDINKLKYHLFNKKEDNAFRKDLRGRVKETNTRIADYRKAAKSNKK